MIPPTHLLAGLAVGRIARGVTGKGPVRPWRDPLVAGALAASVFPDWDVLPGLAVGYEGATFHRGATHSPVGVVLQALAMTPVGLAVWRGLRARLPGLAPPPGRLLLFAVLLAGMGLHALGDALNPWGVAPWWPLSRAGAAWNLAHEGDRLLLGVACACAAAALRLRPRAVLLGSTVLVAAALFWKADRRRRAIEAAPSEALVYPTPRRDCPWAALSAAGGRLRADCIEPGADQEVRSVADVESAASPLVERSKRHPAVADFSSKRRFAYAVLDESADGPIVLWRDLREAMLEAPGDPAFGLAVQFDRQGRIVGVRHRWLLDLTF